MHKKLTAGVIAAALLAGISAAAVMATGTGRPAGQRTADQRTGSSPAGARHGDLAVAAEYLGITRRQLRQELRSGKTLAAVAAATSGKSASGLIDVLVAAKASSRLSELRARATAEVNRIHPVGLGLGRKLTVAAEYLGLAPTQLRADLRASRTLAAIAESTPGRSRAGLIEALMAAAKRRLEARVAAGAITPSQETARLARLARRLPIIVDRPADATRSHRAP